MISLEKWLEAEPMDGRQHRTASVISMYPKMIANPISVSICYIKDRRTVVDSERGVSVQGCFNKLIKRNKLS